MPGSEVVLTAIPQQGPTILLDGLVTPLAMKHHLYRYYGWPQEGTRLLWRYFQGY